jgi:membrane protease YdiL (CAAX protease family)
MNQRLVAFSRFLLGVAVVFTANFLAGSLAPQGASLRRFDLAYRPLLLVFLLAAFAILIAGFDHVPGNPLASMGLAIRRPWLKDLWVGGLIGASMVALAVTVIAVTGTLTIRIVANAYTARLAALVVVILGAGAMAEEVSFRGYPFQRLVEAVGPVAAVVAVSVLFGTAHLLNPHASALGYINTVLIGILLALAYLRTRSLWMPIALHFAWNATLGLVFGLPVSGLTHFAVVTRGRAEGSVWLTGGSYGIEASGVGAAVIALGIAALVTLVRAREQEPAPVAMAAQESPAVSPAVPGNLCADHRSELPSSDAGNGLPSTQSAEPSLSGNSDDTSTA